MKKMFSILFVFATLLWSCEEKFADGEFKFYDIEEPENTNTLPTMPEIGKKGAAFTTRGTQWSFKVSDLKAHWHYSWGSNLSEFEPDNVDFVPMIWGKTGIDAEKVAELKALKEGGKIRYLLGFNEPDGAEQANMTVAEAVELWPMLEEVGLPLGSPGAVNPTGDWMKAFMQEADQKGLRVDFVCVHSYGGTNAQAFLNKLEEVYNLYGKPIWITEFAPADWDATTPDENRHSPEEVLSFMQTVLPELEDLDYLQRYAWFSFGQDRAQGTSSALFDADGNLTTLGEFYADFEPNNLIGPGKKPEEPIVDPDNLIINGGFEAGEIAPWGGFKNNVLQDAALAYEGEFCGRIEGGDGSLLYFIDVEPGATYQLEFYAKWASEADKSFNFSVKEETGEKVRYFQQEIVANADDWTYNKAEFTATEESEIRLIWYKGKGFPAFLLDNVVCKKLD